MMAANCLIIAIAVFTLMTFLCITLYVVFLDLEEGGFYSVLFAMSLIISISGLILCIVLLLHNNTYG